MSSIKDKLKASQGGGNALPTLNIVQRISLKEINGNVVFSRWDKDKKENVEVPSPIQGILIGQAMEATSYSDNLGSKGGNYTSSYYFTNADNIALFAPTSKGYEVVCKGNMEAIEAYVKKESTGNLKKRQVLFVLTEDGLVAVSTNLSIAIDQIRTHKDALTERYIVLEPDLFNEKDETISKKAKEYLGKFRTKNPPKFAAISVGELISENDFDVFGTTSVIEEYRAWKEFKTKGGVESVQVETVEEEKEPVHYNKTSNQMQPNQNAGAIEPVSHETKKSKKHTTENASTPSDDLPF